MSRKTHKECKEVTEFKEQFKEQGEHLINTVFPKKITEIDKLYHSLPLTKIKEIHCSLNIPIPDPVLFNHDITDEPVLKKRKGEYSNCVDQDIPGSKVLVFPKGSAPCNSHLAELAETIKPLIQDLIDHANVLKMWISFMIPKIEDGNNFGVSIQEDTMAEARQVESEAASYLDQISRYFITRAKLVSKVARYPHIDDYRCSVRELDEKEFVSLRLITCELRNHYASLYDLILKNIDKIKKPRSANAESLY